MMNELEAQDWLSRQAGVSRETLERFGLLVRLVVQEGERQNLISRSSADDIWSRHIVDSAQLVRFAPASGTWVDLGSGAGFPGLVVALLHNGEVTLVEERKLRADFLERAAVELGLGHKVKVICSRLERLTPVTFDVISARAFAPLEKLLRISHSFSTAQTRWILPKGRNALCELEAVRTSWQGAFRVEPSVTDDDAGIIVADAVAPRPKGRGSR